jgi:hypothetical protein
MLKKDFLKTSEKDKCCKKLEFLSQAWFLMPVILATQEAETRRISV